MSDTRRAPSQLSGLSPGELEALARSHFEAMWGELHAACAEARAQYHPLSFARRHPFAVAAIAGAVIGFLVRRRRESASAQRAAPEPIGRSIARSLFSNLASAAGRALPGLAAHWFAHKPASAPEADAPRPESAGDP